MLSKAIAILETRLEELKKLPYEDVSPYIVSLEHAISVLKDEHEADLDEMYIEHLRNSA